MAETLNFHETFQPEDTYISKILELASDGFEGDKYTISEIAGIPTGEKKGKVIPHIKYSKYMGLVDYSCNKGVFKLTLTNLGSEMWRQDKYLHEDLSLWLMHYGICRPEFGAPQWSYLIRKLNKGFNSDLSNSFIASILQKEFGVSGGDASKSVSVMKSSYSSGIFERIQYADWDENLIFNEKCENVEYRFLYAYILLNSWEILFPSKMEITLSEVLTDLCYGKIMGFNDEEVDSVLSRMSDDGYISINRQLFPVTVIKMASSNDVIDVLYSALM